MNPFQHADREACEAILKDIADAIDNHNLINSTATVCAVLQSIAESCPEGRDLVTHGIAQVLYNIETANYTNN